MNAHRGFTLIDVVVGTSLMLILFLALFGTLRASLIVSSLAKAKAAGTELANTQMEYLHGLSYDSLGTVGGIPAGIVPQTATSTVDGIAYGVHTYVEYHDDPADGLGASDTNGVTTDYKIGKVTVSYTLYGLRRSVALVSNFVPPGIESSTGGGTLSIHVVDKNNVDVANATVQIINTATNPAINFTTFSDGSGLVTIGGAATSSQYQIYVSRTGYSSAQTYARTGTNVNPTPGYLTVTRNQTTSATFAVDLLATLVISTFSPAETAAFSDTFASSANLASQTSTQVASGALILASQTLSGSALSTTTSPSYLDGWGILQATLSTPSGTIALIHVDDMAGVLLPDSVLPGNSAGFSSFPVSLTNVSTTTYSGLVIEADLTSNATTTTPELQDWSLSYTDGPTPRQDVAYTLTGAKTIGTTAGGALIYKTVVSNNTGAAATKSETLEWDAYTPTFGSPLIDSCQAIPFALSPASAVSVVAIIGTPTDTTLPIVVVDSANSVIASAKVVLTSNGYAATVPTSQCGLSFFNGLSPGIYSATVSALGHTTKVFPNITVVGHTTTTTLVLP